MVYWPLLGEELGSGVDYDFTAKGNYLVFIIAAIRKQTLFTTVTMDVDSQEIQ